MERRERLPILAPFIPQLVLESPVKKPEKDRRLDLTLTDTDRKCCNRYRLLTAVRLTVYTISYFSLTGFQPVKTGFQPVKTGFQPVKTG
jgi:hypothetical protein